MTRVTLDRTGKLAQLLGGLLCAALGLRVMTLAIGEAQARRAPMAELSVASPKVGPSRPHAPATARSRHQPAPERSSAPGGPSMRLMLSVNAGPERSEVYVNGSRLGFSPYVGDLTCKQGEQLRVEVVPPKGALVTRSAICEGRTLLIR
ncbi:MAG: hypothetical protein RL685_2562 [Pseudomonadota bacterium]|jgi:hypothetical protein